MKISEIKGEKLFDILADVIEPITNIADSAPMQAIFDDIAARSKDNDAQSIAQFTIDEIRAHVPQLLRENKKDMIKLLSVLNEQTTQEYCADLTLGKLMSDSLDLLAQDEMVRFLQMQGLSNSQEVSKSA